MNLRGINALGSHANLSSSACVSVVIAFLLSPCVPITAQGAEAQDFETWPTTGGWGTTQHEGWKLSDGQVKSGRGGFGSPIDTRCGWLYDYDDSTNTWLSSPLFPGGVLSISIWTRPDAFSGGSSSAVLQKTTNELDWTDIEAFTINGSDWSQRIFSVDSDSPTRLRIRKTGDSAANSYAGIDNVDVIANGTTTTTSTSSTSSTTSAAPVNNQDFETWPTTASWGTTEHEGWTLSDGQVKGGRGGFGPPIGNRCGWLYDYDDSTNSWAQSPLFATGVVSVSVWTRQDTHSGGSSSVVLEKTTNENDWTNVDSFLIDSTFWTQQTFSVDSLSPTRLRIRKTGDTAANTYAGIDDIEVTAIGTTTTLPTTTTTTTSTTPTSTTTTTGPPIVTNAGGATGITDDAAFLNGHVSNTFGFPVDVRIYWGTNDGGVVETDWSTNEYLPNTLAGSFSKYVSGLDCNFVYYYRCYATNNGFGDAWAPTTASFSLVGCTTTTSTLTSSTSTTTTATLTSSTTTSSTSTTTSITPTSTTSTTGPPIVTNASGATGITDDSAFLNGHVSNTFGFPVDVRIYWGTSDGGVVEADWSTNEYLPNTLAGSFSNYVSGLDCNFVYYYRCYATNNGFGDAWAPTTASFSLVGCTTTTLTSTTSTTSTTTTTTTSTVALVLHYTFDVDEGGLVSDDSGEGHTGTVFGASWTSQGVLGGAYSFDGSNGFISVNGFRGFGLQMVEDFAASVWVKSTVGSRRMRAYGVHNAGPNTLFQLIMNNRDLGAGVEDGGVTFSIRDEDGGSTTIVALTNEMDVTDGEWHMVTSVRDDDQLLLYVDGVAVDQRAIANIDNTVEFEYDFGVGARTPMNNVTDYYEGELDDLRIYCGSLSQTDVITLYNAASTTSTTSTSSTSTTTTTVALVLHYTFDVDEGGIVSDQSGGGHTGTVLGATWSANGVLGGACSFDGMDDYISSFETEALVQSGQYSFGVWFKTDDGLQTRPQYLYGAHNTGSGDNRIYTRIMGTIEATPGQVHVGTKITGTDYHLFTGTFLGDGSSGWSHLVAVIDDANDVVRCYIDGVETPNSPRAIGGANFGNYVNTQNLFIGTRNIDGAPHPSGDYFDGLLDDFRVYCGSLSQAEVIALYNAGSTTSTTSTSSTSTTTDTSSTSTSSTSTTSTTSTSSTTSPLSSEYRATYFYGGGYFSFEAGDVDPALTYGHGFLAPGSGDGARFDFWIAEDGVVDGTGVEGGGGASTMDPNYAAGNNDLFLGSTVFNEDGVDQYQGGSGIDADSFAFDLPNGGNLAEFAGQGIADGTAVGYGRVFETDVPQAGDWYYVGASEVLRDTSDPRVPPNAVIIGRAMGIGGLDQIDATPFSFKVVTETSTTTTTSTSTTGANLVLAYSFDQDDCPIVGDESGSGHSGVVCGATWSPNGLDGGAYCFDGLNDWIQIPNDAQLNFGTDAFSLSAWIKTSKTGGQTLFFKSNPADPLETSAGYILSLGGACGSGDDDDDSDSDSDVVAICHADPGNPSSTQTIIVSLSDVPDHLAHGDSLGECILDAQSGLPLGAVGDGNDTTEVGASLSVSDSAWHHIVLVRNRHVGNLELYIDGVLDSIELDTVSGSTSNPFDLRIGRGVDCSGAVVDCDDCDDDSDSDSGSDSDNDGDSDSDSDSDQNTGSDCGCWFDGLMDEMKIYSGALTASAVAELYAQHAQPPSPPSLVPDVDADGIADYVELAFTGSTTAMDAEDDIDGDTSINLHEVSAGSNPMDYNSVFKIEVFTADGTDCVLSWQSEPGKAYTVLGASSLAEGYVPILQIVPATPPANTVVISDPELNYFRVELTE